MTHQMQLVFTDKKMTTIDPHAKQSVSYSLKRRKQINHGADGAAQDMPAVPSTHHLHVGDLGVTSGTSHDKFWQPRAQGVTATFEEILRKSAKTGADSFHSHPHAFTDIHLGRQRDEAQSLPVFNVLICETSPRSFSPRRC